VLTSELDEKIQTFVDQHGLHGLRIPNQGLIYQVEHDYRLRLFELEFEEMRASGHQRDIFNRVMQAKLQQERTRVNVDVLKQRLYYQHLPRSFQQQIQFPSQLTFDEVNSTNRRQCLRDHCDKIIERTKSELMLVYIEMAEAKMHEAQLTFDREYRGIQQKRATGQWHERLSPPMLDLIERQFQYLHQHLQRLYELKVSFFVKAPTVKN
jgi:hypothetical protein